MPIIFVIKGEVIFILFLCLLEHLPERSWLCVLLFVTTFIVREWYYLLNLYALQ